MSSRRLPAKQLELLKSPRGDANPSPKISHHFFSCGIIRCTEHSHRHVLSAYHVICACAVAAQHHGMHGNAELQFVNKLV